MPLWPRALLVSSFPYFLYVCMALKNKKYVAGLVGVDNPRNITSASTMLSTRIQHVQYFPSLLPRGGAYLRTRWVLKNAQSEYPWVPWVLTEHPLRTHWEPTENQTEHPLRACFFLCFQLQFFWKLFLSTLWKMFIFWEPTENPLRTQPSISPEFVYVYELFSLSIHPKLMSILGYLVHSSTCTLDR